MSAKTVIHVEAAGKGMQSVSTAGKHSITIDEPPQLGGEDTGPNPLIVLLSSLAGCENVVANLVAQEIGFKFDGLDFDIKGTLDARGFMGVEGVKPQFEHVSIVVRVKTDEPDERIAELKEKTDQRCPVYMTLHAAGIEIDSSWVRA
ncbi:OsmC family protein [Exiguobacterium flavidum]|uniref:OsmC family protein n=1 Tax=Exiguobacterium flavidum TaxID=2184695 RepID=UPI000DF7786A|nr:OsmC family protein [Exiguobacterium flavidum]